MRVLMVCPTLGIGGAEQLAVAYARGLQERGHEVEVVYGYTGSRVPEMTEAGVPSRFLSPRLLSPRTLPEWVRALRAVVREFDPDVLYAQSVTAALTGRLAAPRRPSLVTIHGIQASDERSAAAILRLAATRVTAVSQASADGIRRHAGAPPIEVLEPGIDLRLLTTRAEEPLDEPLIGSPSLVCVARHHPAKGIDVLLRAMPLVLAELPDAGLTTVGPTPERYAALVDELGLGASVRLTGPRTNPLPHVRAADIVVLPSRREGLPVVALEALGLGRPLVATRVGGTPTLVREDETGWLAEPEDEASLAAAVAAAAGDAGERRRRGEAGRELVRTTYSLTPMLDRVDALLHEIASRPRIGRRADRRPSVDRA